MNYFPAVVGGAPDAFAAAGNSLFPSSVSSPPTNNGPSFQSGTAVTKGNNSGPMMGWLSTMMAEQYTGPKDEVFRYGSDIRTRMDLLQMINSKTSSYIFSAAMMNTDWVIKDLARLYQISPDVGDQFQVEQKVYLGTFWDQGTVFSTGRLVGFEATARRYTLQESQHAMVFDPRVLKTTEGKQDYINQWKNAGYMLINTFTLPAVLQIVRLADKSARENDRILFDRVRTDRQFIDAAVQRASELFTIHKYQNGGELLLQRLQTNFIRLNNGRRGNMLLIPEILIDALRASGSSLRDSIAGNQELDKDAFREAEQKLGVIIRPLPNINIADDLRYPIDESSMAQQLMQVLCYGTLNYWRDEYLLSGDIKDYNSNKPMIDLFDLGADDWVRIHVKELYSKMGLFTLERGVALDGGDDEDYNNVETTDAGKSWFDNKTVYDYYKEKGRLNQLIATINENAYEDLMSVRDIFTNTPSGTASIITPSKKHSSSSSSSSSSGSGKKAKPVETKILDFELKDNLFVQSLQAKILNIVSNIPARVLLMSLLADRSRTMMFIPEFIFWSKFESLINPGVQPEHIINAYIESIKSYHVDRPSSGSLSSTTKRYYVVGKAGPFGGSKEVDFDRKILVPLPVDDTKYRDWPSIPYSLPRVVSILCMIYGSSSFGITSSSSFTKVPSEAKNTFDDDYLNKLHERLTNEQVANVNKAISKAGIEVDSKTSPGSSITLDSDGKTIDQTGVYATHFVSRSSELKSIVTSPAEDPIKLSEKDSTKVVSQQKRRININALLKVIKMDGRFMLYIIRKNLWPPFGVGIFRPHTCYDTLGSALTYSDRANPWMLSVFRAPEVIQGTHADPQKVSVSMKIQEAAIVTNDKAVLGGRHSQATAYRHGGGTRLWNPFNGRHKDDFLRGRAGDRSMFVVPLDHHEKLEKVIDIRGSFHISNNQGVIRDHYQFAGIFKSLWDNKFGNVRSESDSIRSQASMSDTPCYGNTVLHQTVQRNYNMKGECVGVSSSCDPWGDKYYPGVGRERCGQGNQFLHNTVHGTLPTQYTVANKM